MTEFAEQTEIGLTVPERVVIEERALVPVSWQVPVAWTLPRYTFDRPCAKCGTGHVRTAYHAGGAKQGESCWDLWQALPRDERGNLADAAEIPEHQDRHCINCGVAWTEAIPTADEIADHEAAKKRRHD